MALNVGRGLFRLWVVFSGLWVCLSVLIAIEGFDTGKHYMWHHGEKSVKEITQSYLEEDIRLFGQKVTKEYEIESFSRPILHVGIFIEGKDLEAAMLTATPKVLAKERGRALSTFLSWSGLALVPPAVILAIGSALYWALLGFRPRSS